MDSQRYRELLAINRAIAGAQAYDDVLRLVVEKTAAFTGATACMLLLSQEDGLARVVRSVGIDPARAAALAVRLTDPLDQELCGVLGCQSMSRFVRVPVTGARGLLGVLAVCWSGACGLDGLEYEDLLSALADQAAIALENLEHVRRLSASAEALRISTERFRNLAETTSDWLWEVDENGVYTYASPRVRELLGYEPQEVVGKTPFDLMLPDEAARVGQAFAAIAAERKPFAGLENANRHREGHPVVLETSGVPIFDSAGEFRGYRGIDRDITRRKRVEQALRASEAKLAGIISTAADAIITINEAQCIVMFNEGAERIFGWRREEVLGQPVEILIPERYRGRHAQQVTSFNSGSDMAIKIEQGRRAIVALRSDGKEFPADAAVSRLHDGGEWINTIVLRDTTEQRRVEHEELFLAEVGTVLAETLDFEGTLDSIAQLALRLHADLCVIDFADERGELRRMRAVGSDPAREPLYEALRQIPIDTAHPPLSGAVVHSKRPELLAEVSAATLADVAQSEEHRRLLEVLGPTSMMGVPLIAHGRLLGALVVASCRPERQFAVSDLKLLTELGRRAALALDNARLYQSIQRAVQTRDDVLGIVAHDLRNPLNTIVLQASILRRLEAQLSPRARQSGETIERSAARMNRLIQDLLDITRMENGSLGIEPRRLPAGQLVRACEDAHRALVSSSSLQLEADIAADLPDIWGDRDRLFQVFENLLGNAVKFTAPGGRIAVGARPADGEIVFWVRDTGQGVPAADLPRLFDRFWQARKTGRRGLGLGLPIAKAIVDAHGGRIWVDSVPGQGSTFQFTVPLASRVEEGLREPPRAIEPCQASGTQLSLLR